MVKQDLLFTTNAKNKWRNRCLFLTSIIWRLLVPFGRSECQNILWQQLKITNVLHRLIAGLGSYFKQAIMASMLLTTICRWKLINALPGDPVWHWRRVACVVFAMNMIDLTLICTQPQSKYNLYFACVEPNEFQVTYLEQWHDRNLGQGTACQICPVPSSCHVTLQNYF